MTLDHEAYLEAELRQAPRSLSNRLFHYTNSESAIFGILATGTLRLSPFESTNDLWESRPLYPSLSSHYDDGSFDETFELWEEIDRNVRLHSKVACLTQDWDLHPDVLNPQAMSGWAHLSLWAHYGAGHTGICLSFERDELIQSFTASSDNGARRFHGPVKYLTVPAGLAVRGIDIGQVKEFGVDAVATNFAETNSEAIFFRKHSDWSNEAEYRLVLMDQSILPAFINVREVLTGVFLGDAFPQARLPALMKILEEYPNVDIQQLRFHNRQLACFPFEDPASKLRRNDGSRPGWDTPKRLGNLDERLRELRGEEAAAGNRRERAEALCSDLTSALHLGISSLSKDLSTWPNTQVAAHQHTSAVPPYQRSRRPGVPGEQIHFERGYMCVVENLPKYSYTLVASAAFQMLDDDQIRLHAVMSTEEWSPHGNERDERWRVSRECPLAEGLNQITTLISDLHKAAEDARLGFDVDRGVLS